MVSPPAGPGSNKYSPPGGSFQYNQSSVDGPYSIETESGEQTAASDGKHQGSAQCSHWPTWNDRQMPAPYDKPLRSAMTRTKSRLRTSPKPLNAWTTYALPSTSPNRGSDRCCAGQPGVASNTLRIVPSTRVEREESTSNEDNPDENPRGSPVFRMIVDDSPASDDRRAGCERTARTSDSHRSSQMRLVSADATADADEVKLNERPLAKPSPTAAASSSWSMPPAPGTDYAFAPDYSVLAVGWNTCSRPANGNCAIFPSDGQTDSYGGSVVLPSSTALETFKAGQYVAVRGALATPSTGGGNFAPLYRLDAIEHMSRSRRRGAALTRSPAHVAASRTRHRSRHGTMD